MVKKIMVLENSVYVILASCVASLVGVPFLIVSLLAHSFTPKAFPFVSGNMHTQRICKVTSSWETIGAVHCNISSTRMFDIVLVSTGGVGSTAMFETMATHVSRRLNYDNDMDGLKHRVFPITSSRLQELVQTKHNISCATRIFVYTFGDAAASVLSLYRRLFHAYHNIKLNNRPFPDRCFPSNISQYADDGVDYFGLENHFMSWMHGGMCSLNVPVFFLRSEGRSIPKVLEILKTAVINPHQAFEGSIMTLHINASHYASNVSTAGDYAKVQLMYQRFQRQLDALGYLSMAFKSNVKRLV